jgi:hypothetical protein
MTLDELKSLALRADAALRDDKPLVLATDEEKMIVRGYAEAEYAYQKENR